MKSYKLAVKLAWFYVLFFALGHANESARVPLRLRRARISSKKEIQCENILL
ncbi:hypothetical protein V7201_02895 [Bacillus sp. JJ1122]|uniref:hypothetical protein n=1 Tax=Bacillus sp. JJ1122 TaxID=3122951 RepID=UPI002FFDE598